MIEDSGLRTREGTAWLGMIVFLASWAMMFAALLFVGGAVRARLPSWPPAGLPDLPVVLPVVNTLVLGLGSLELQRALARAQSGRAWVWGVLRGLGLGVLFLGLQAICWSGLVRAGLRWEDGVLAGVVYGFTGLHALHVVVGLGGLAAVVYRAATRPRLPLLALRLWTMYWHFVGVIWLVICAVAFMAW